MYQKKLMFLHHLLNLEESSLASEIFAIQKEFNLPGFVKEARDLLQMFSLTNIIDEKDKTYKLQWKKMVTKAIYSNYENELKSQITSYSKLKDGPMASETFQQRGYLEEMSMREARMFFPSKK